MLRRIHRHLKMEEELWPWRCTRCQRINRKNALKCAICQAYWTSGTRHSTQPKPKNAASPEWEEWSQQWDASQDAWNWEDHAQSRSQSRSSAHSMHSAHSGTSVQSEGKGQRRGRGKGKGKESHKKGQRKGKGPAKDGNATLASSPFAPLTAELPPWPPMDSAVTNQMPVILPAQQAMQSPMENIAQKKEVVQALKAAYPEISQAPQETRDLIDKMEKDIEQLEKENNKSTTKNLHASTKALGKALKTLTETLEAKRTHRLRWTKHVARSGGGQILGEPVARVQTTAGSSTRDRRQSSTGHRDCEECHTNLVCRSHSSHAGFHATDHGGQCRTRRWPSGHRPRSRDCTAAASDRLAKLCRVPGCRSDISAAADNCNIGDGRRGYGKKSQKTSLSFGAIWWCWWGNLFTFGRADHVTQGGVSLVQCNSLHDATFTAPSVEAYVFDKHSHAASTWQLSSLISPAFCPGSIRFRSNRSIVILSILFFQPGKPDGMFCAIFSRIRLTV